MKTLIDVSVTGLPLQFVASLQMQLKDPWASILTVGHIATVV